MKNSVIVSAVFLFSFLLCLSGCETTNNLLLDEPTPFEKARTYQSRGDLGRAIPFYSSYIRDYPQGEHVEEAQYRLGQCYFLHGQIVQAKRELERYLLLYPRGEFAMDARSYLAKINKDIESTQVPSELKPLEKREKAIEQLEKQVKDNPNDVLLRVDLANAYIDVSELKLAEKAIEDAEAQADTYSEMKAVRRAKNRLAETKRKPPVHTTDLYDNPGPLKVFNAQGEVRSLDRGYEGQRDVYVVTGTIVNESDERFTGVQMQVDLYGISAGLIDTKTVSIGTVPAHQRRPFSVKFLLMRSVTTPAPRYDYNISRFECRLIY